MTDGQTDGRTTDRLWYEINIPYFSYEKAGIKITISCPFSCNSIIKFHSKKSGSDNMTMLYPNLCNNEVCYKWTALYMYSHLRNRKSFDFDWFSVHVLLSLSVQL